jgi:hypothetical protein
LQLSVVLIIKSGGTLISSFCHLSRIFFAFVSCTLIFNIAAADLGYSDKSAIAFRNVPAICLSKRLIKLIHSSVIFINVSIVSVLYGNVINKMLEYTLLHTKRMD